MAVKLRSYYSEAERLGDSGAGFFIAEEADGLGDKQSVNNKQGHWW